MWAPENVVHRLAQARNKVDMIKACRWVGQREVNAAYQARAFWHARWLAIESINAMALAIGQESESSSV